MEGFNPYAIMKTVAANGLRNQTRNDGDYEDESGILICGKCGEPRQRFMLFDDPTDDDPEHKSELKVVTMCRCEREEEERERRKEEAAKDMEKIQRLRNASLLDEKLRGATFDAFKVTKYNERNLKLCRRYAMKFDQMVEKDQGLIFWGSVGTGKSFAAACIANYLLDRKVPVVMTSFVKLLEVFQSGRDEETSILNRLGYAKLVIFDDLGAERGTDFALEKVYNIVDSRYRKNLPMILTTNLTIEEMKSEVDMRYRRIYDRVFETCYPMQFTGPSWRMKEASRRYKDMEELLGVD
ncbi:ATP-binding protein [Anaerotruncus colihominis]|uniref:ATP-binding protein n=1 Tax=Anaerotruncus colihominis TaxID=169435 RepID=UPI0029429D48|nr:ATP-binding protein [Anaerotruncus colihominis]